MIKNVSAETYLDTPLNIRIPRKGPATEVREVMGWLLGGTGSPIWSIMAAPTEHPNTPQRIHPGDQLTKTQPSSAMPHNQHLTATPQTQTRYKRKQRVYHCLYCPRCHHRSTWDTWAISAENNKYQPQNFRSASALPAIYQGIFDPGNLEIHPLWRINTVGKKREIPKKINDQSENNDQSYYQPNDQSNRLSPKVCPQALKSLSVTASSVLAPEIYRSTEDNG